MLGFGFLGFGFAGAGAEEMPEEGDSGYMSHSLNSSKGGQVM